MKTNKQKILAAASSLFLKGGSGALSVRAIAKHAGLSTIGIYSHFDGKQGVLDALYIEGFEMVAEAMNVLDGTGSPRQAVLEASRNYLHLAESRQAHYRLIFGEGERHYTPSEVAAEVGAMAFARLTTVVAGLLPPDTSKQAKQDAAIQFWSLLHGGVSLRQHAVSELVDMSDWQQRIMDAVEMLIAGFEKSDSIAL